MKTWIKAILLVSAALLISNCIRNQTYILSQTASAKAGDTIDVKILHRALLLGPLDTATKKLKEKMYFTNLELWFGNSAKNTVLGSGSMKIFAYRMAQFDATILSQSDLDSNSKITRLLPTPSIMGTRMLSRPPDTMIVRNSAGLKDTLFNDGRDSNIVWSGHRGEILAARTAFLTSTVIMDTIVFFKGATPDTITTGPNAQAGFVIGVEVSMRVVVGPYILGKVNPNMYYYARARAKIDEVDDPDLDLTANATFGGWSTLNITNPVVSIEPNSGSAQMRQTHSGNFLQFQWPDKGHRSIRILNSNGALIRTGRSENGSYILDKSGITPASYFLLSHSDSQPLTQKFIVP